MKNLRHPSRHKLAAWLEGNAPEIDAHIDHCAKCAERLEGFDGQTSAIGNALEHLLRPPNDLGPTIRTGIDRTTEARSDLSLLVDLLALPAHTLEALNKEGPDV